MRFVHATTAEERAWVAERTAAMDRFWACFAADVDQLDAAFRSGATLDVAGWMNERLPPVDPRIGWEFGPGLAGGRHRLMLSRDGTPTLGPLVDALVARAPKVDGWEVYGARMPQPVPAALQIVKGRTGRSLPAGAAVCLSEGQDGLVDVEIRVPGATGEEVEHEAGCVLLEALLGERVFDDWIGAVRVVAPPSRFRRWMSGSGPEVPLDALVAAVEKHEASFTADARPWSERLPEGKASVLKLEPTPSDDPPGFSDLLVASAMNVDLWLAQHRRFAPARFATRGEVFAYLKLDGSEGLDAERFADRGAIEEAIEQVLVPDGLGVVTGGGTGLRYSYIDLVLTDLGRAWPRVAERLRAGRIPKRTWLLFFDPSLADEWLSVYEDAGPPPSTA